MALRLRTSTALVEDLHWVSNTHVRSVGSQLPVTYAPVGADTSWLCRLLQSCTHSYVKIHKHTVNDKIFLKSQLQFLYTTKILKSYYLKNRLWGSSHRYKSMEDVLKLLAIFISLCSRRAVVCVCVSQRMTFQSWFSLSSTWVPVVKWRATGMVSTLAC